MLQDGVAPNVVTCTMIVEGYCKQQKIVEALKFVQFTRDWGIHPNMFMYSVLIKALCKEGSSDLAWAIVGTMIKGGLSHDVVIYTILIGDLAKWNLNGALKLFSTMLSDDNMMERIKDNLI
ncbi:hypothetical protein HPP92_022590 [Vanilla planifolia]|uniref:Pentatricopeptide repeat-containing protein n=1 Tax=Vanilla planifolia TaxID=51239 RepID=A0A835UDP2_VANPL|nr:hypothetical protein HPP92_022590 [Vanilla planifolia]